MNIGWEKLVEPMVIAPTPQKAFDINSIDTIGSFPRNPRSALAFVTILHLISVTITQLSS